MRPALRREGLSLKNTVMSPLNPTSLKDSRLSIVEMAEEHKEVRVRPSHVSYSLPLVRTPYKHGTVVKLSDNSFLLSIRNSTVSTPKMV
jgi:hypothetical protein